MLHKNTPTETPLAPKIANVEQLETELAEQPGGVFSTTLSPNEQYLLAQSGLEPVRVVVGTIVYSMGIRGLVQSVKRAFQSGEMVHYSHLNQVARRVAVERMEKEAGELGATGVVGVQIDVREYADFLEVVAIGTAVRPHAESMLPFPPREALEVVVGA